MPRYFFDVINGEGPMRDDEGVELLTQTLFGERRLRL